MLTLASYQRLAPGRQAHHNNAYPSVFDLGSQAVSPHAFGHHLGRMARSVGRQCKDKDEARTEREAIVTAKVEEVLKVSMRGYIRWRTPHKEAKKAGRGFRVRQTFALCQRGVAC